MTIRVFLAAAIAALLALAPTLVAADGRVEEVVAFDPAAAEFPEGITVDKTGDVYVSMTLLGQIRKIAPDGTQSVVATIPAPGFALAAWRARRGAICTSRSRPSTSRWGRRIRKPAGCTGSALMGQRPGWPARAR